MIIKELIDHLKTLDPEETSLVIINDLDENQYKHPLRFNYDVTGRIFISCSRFIPLEK